jgi:hypothetical protein
MVVIAELQSLYAASEKNIFEDLHNGKYWSGTESSNSKFKWFVDMGTGQTGTLAYTYTEDVLAVRGATVSTSAPPISGTGWLFGCGLRFFVKLRRDKFGKA